MLVQGHWAGASRLQNLRSQPASLPAFAHLLRTTRGTCMKRV
jgi:hypothetical protein